MFLVSGCLVDTGNVDVPAPSPATHEPTAPTDGGVEPTAPTPVADSGDGETCAFAFIFLSL